MHTETFRPLRGAVLTPDVLRGMSAQDVRALRKAGARPIMAGGDLTNTSQPDPLGVGVSGTQLTVDMYVNPPTIIPQILRDFVAANQGYFIEQIFGRTGQPVRSGSVIYTETMPQDYFLDSTQSIAPRSPGSEAPRIAGQRRAPKMAFPESWSGSIEVTDEARRWNQVLTIQQTFQQAANTFAQTLQSRGESVLSSFVTSTSRFIVGGAGTFSDWQAALPIEVTTSTAPRPASEFARVKRTFLADLVGVQPDVVIASLADAEAFDRVYGGQAQAVLDRYNLRMIGSPRRPDGQRLYVRSGQVGTILWDKPLTTPEYTRQGWRFTDVYTLETVPVFIAYGADSILEVRQS